MDYETLNNLLKLGLDVKIHRSTAILKHELEKSDRPCVAFSGGKCSLVALHLAKQVDTYNRITAVYNDTGVAYPQTKEYVKQTTRQLHSPVIITEPETTFWKVVDEHGLPEESRANGEPKCCYYLKLKPMREVVRKHNFDLLITGEQATESRQRTLTFFKKGEAFTYRNWYKTTLRKCKPLSIWTEQDIWQYIENHELPVHPAYKQYDIARLGCLPCTGFLDWKEKLKKISPQLLEKLEKLKEQ